MLIHSKKLGPVEIARDETVIFREGILAFEHLHEYAILSRKEDSPFRFLQSVDDVDVTFAIMSPYQVRYDYRFCVPVRQVDDPGAGGNGRFEIYCIVTVPEDVAGATINLQAPLIIDRRTRCGKQVVLTDGMYTTRHNLLAEIQRSVFLTDREKRVASSSG